MSRPIRVLALAMGDGINLVLNFLLIPILARTFDVETYGTYGQVLMLAGFCVTLLSMGLNNILLKDLSQSEDKEEVFCNNVLSGFLVGTAGMALLILLAPAIGNHFNNPHLVSGLRYYAPYIPVAIAISSCNAALIYLGKSKTIVVTSVVVNVIRLTGIIFISVYAGQSLDFIFSFLTLLGIVQLIVLLKEIVWKLEISKISAQKLRQQLWSALPLGVTVMISSVFTVADGIFVSTILGVQDYAVYRNGAMFIPLVMNLYAAINSIILPDVSVLYANQNFGDIARMKKNIASLFVLIVYPVVIFFIFFADDLVELIFSEKYALSTSIFQLYNISLLFRICNAEDLFLVANKAGRLPVFYTIACIFVLAGNFILIQIWGINGAAITSLSGTLLLMLMIYYYGFKLIGINIRNIVPWNNIVQVIMISLPLILAAVWLGNFLQFQFYFLIVFFPYLLLCYFIFLKRKWLDVRVVRNMFSSLIGETKALHVYDRLFS